MVLSHGNHGNFSKKVTWFLEARKIEESKSQNFSQDIFPYNVPVAIGKTHQKG